MESFEPVLFILGAWAFWGTYPVPFKSKAAIAANTDAFAFQCMKSLMVFITSWLVLSWKELTFTLWGLVGAACWIPAGLLYITSIQLNGIAFSSPIANGCTIIVNFCWGAFYFKEEVKNPYLSVLAMAVMITGMAGVSIAVNYEKISKIRAEKTQKISINVSADISDAKHSEKDPLLATPQTLYPQLHEQYTSYQQTSPQAYQQPQPVLVEVEEGKKIETKAQSTSKFILGIICALMSGVFGASQNVALRNAPPKAHGITYVISFGIGAVIVSFAFTFVYVCVRLIMNKGLPTVNLKLSIIPGSMAGFLWSCGNICNIYATLAWGTTIGAPLVNCNMMVSGIWGVFYYNEAPRITMKLLFVASCTVLLGGVTLLSLYG